MPAVSAATTKPELAARNINLALINLNGRLSLDMWRGAGGAEAGAGMW